MAYGTIMARYYQNAEYRAVYQLAIDAWAVQHPQRPQGTDQSLALHLMTLLLFLDEDVDPARGPSLHKEMMVGRHVFEHLDPPVDRGALTVAHVVSARDAVEHARLVREWAASAWQAWTPHHPVVRAWVQRWRQTAAETPRPTTAHSSGNRSRR